MVGVCLGLFLTQLDATAVNLALAAIGRQLHADVRTLQWVVDGYNLPFAALLLTGGNLGDRYGRRRLFLIGIAAFVCGSIACGLAPAAGILVAGRALQGLGAAMAIPQSLAILSVSFPDRAERNRAMAAWSLTSGVALAAGPLVGGLLVDHGGWRLIFWVNLIPGLAAMVLALLAVAESADPTPRRIDLPGQVLAAVALIALTFTVVEGRGYGWTSAPIVTAAVVAAAGLALFLVVEARRDDPMLPLVLFRRGQLPAAVTVATCMTFGMYGFLMLTSLDLQRAGAATSAGLWMLPMPLVFAAVSPLVGRLVSRVGPRLPITLGMALMGTGVLGYAVFGGWMRMVAFVVIGLGLGLTTGPVVGVATASVAPERAGLAGGTTNLARMLGAALGVAVLGTVFAAVGGSAVQGAGFAPGLQAALIVGGLVELAGALVAAAWIRRDHAAPPTTPSSGEAVPARTSAG